MDNLAIAPLVQEHMCVNCGSLNGGDCGYGERDYYSGEFDCTHPDAGELECPCYETFCEKCRKTIKK